MERINDKILSFDNIEEMFTFIAENKYHADTIVRDWQRHLVPGDHAVQAYDDDIAIYHTIQPLEFEEGPLPENIVLVLSHSILCPDGEIGTVHVASFTASLDEMTWSMFEEIGYPETITDLVSTLHFIVRLLQP